MKILKNSPEKGKWKVWLISPPSKPSFLLTGHIGKHYGDNQQEYKGIPSAVVCYLEQGVECREIAVPLIEGGFTMQGETSSRMFTLEEVGTGIQYSVATKGMVAIMKSLQAGTLKIENGAVHGTWTFIKQGMELSLFPWQGEPAFAEEESFVLNESEVSSAFKGR